MADIPVTKLARSGVIAKTLVKASGKSLKKKLSGRHNQVLDGEMGQLIFEALSKLKGAGLKVAQMLSNEHAYLPPDFRKQLAKSCYQAPGINRALVRKIIISQLGDKPEKVFDRFDSQPFAAASLGQVHKAISKDGEELAVKIQYPGIAQTIESDLGILKQLLKVVPKQYEIADTLPEIESRLLEEVDYVHEIKSCQYFDKLGLTEIGVQRVLPELSSKTVLVSELVEGKHLDKWLESNPSQQARNQVCQSLIDLFVESLKQGYHLHADPNIGNFIIDDNNKVTLIDFGCVQPANTEAQQRYLSMLKAFRDKDLEKIHHYYNHFYFPESNEYWSTTTDELFSQFVTWKSSLLQQVGFDFSEHDEYIVQGMELAYKAFHGEKVPFRIDQNILFIERVLFGYLQICQTAKAKVTFNLEEKL
ncbi:ABC1 kinase family protein [Vibrio sonorensis]|uniref:ABC1 kinase family protein n=1 Tax=Vibrio sonorensis TaxID=1004316 RepID=UPI0008DAD465|nr:AarF/ABC1/UbiB kinase family protein [Vibrio sonorensis]